MCGIISARFNTEKFHSCHHLVVHKQRRGVLMNRLSAVLHAGIAPFIGRQPYIVPIEVAVGILGRDNVVSLEDASKCFGVSRGLSRYSDFGSVNASEVQLRALAGLVWVVPRFAHLTRIVDRCGTGLSVNIRPSLLNDITDKSEINMPSARGQHDCPQRCTVTRPADCA